MNMGTYATGGDTLDLTATPFTGANAFASVASVRVIEGPYDVNGAKTVVDTCSSIQYVFATSRAPATGLLMAYAEGAVSGVEAEVSDTTDLSAVFVRLHIVGQ